MGISAREKLLRIPPGFLGIRDYAAARQRDRCIQMTTNSLMNNSETFPPQWHFSPRIMPLFPDTVLSLDFADISHPIVLGGSNLRAEFVS